MVKFLEDSFRFKEVPFIVEVERTEMFIDGNDGSMNGVNVWGKPTGYGENDRIPKSKVICEVMHCRVRPDYPYPIRKEWPDDVDKHQHTVILLEEPVKSKGLIFTSWETERKRDAESVDIQQMADETIEKLKDAYHSSSIQSLENSP